MWEDISAVIKHRAAIILEETKDFLGDSFKAIYLRILISLTAMAVICSSIVAFITKLADSLDANSVVLWTRSMSLYVVVIILASLALKASLTGVHRDRRMTKSSPDAPIQRISQRRRNGKRRKSRRN
jgi:hypothetical protein